MKVVKSSEVVANGNDPEQGDEEARKASYDHRNRALGLGLDCIEDRDCGRAHGNDPEHVDGRVGESRRAHLAHGALLLPAQVIHVGEAVVSHGGRVAEVGRERGDARTTTVVLEIIVIILARKARHNQEDRRDEDRDERDDREEAKAAGSRAQAGRGARYGARTGARYGAGNGLRGRGGGERHAARAAETRAVRVLGAALGTIHSEMTAVKRFSCFLKARKPELESLQELSREDIEDYLIYLQTETTERKNYRSDLYGLKRVIEDVGNIYERRHLLELFLNNDFPSTPRYQFKFYSDATIKRLNSHIFNMDEQIARALIVHQLLGTRISDTLTLRMDCLREKEGRYFVRIDQVKSITYEKAVSNEVGRLILKAMEYTKERYGETEYVFVKKDDPSKPYQYGMIQAQVMRMIRQKDIRDDNGELLKFGTHIFRHCYGKKLTELHIEDWMIARLLGHKTLQSVHHYRRIGNKVMADETRKTREKMDLILMDIIKGWDGYEL